MNRYDEIQAVARDVASNVHADPEKRNAMADGLIRLVGLMLAAQGKAVAVKGESDMNSHYCNDPDCDCSANGCTAEYDLSHGIYMTGESMQDAARALIGDCAGADLERYERPVWTHVDRRPALKPGQDFRAMFRVESPSGPVQCHECGRPGGKGHMTGCPWGDGLACTPEGPCLISNNDVCAYHH